MNTWVYICAQVYIYIHIYIHIHTFVLWSYMLLRFGITSRRSLPLGACESPRGDFQRPRSRNNKKERPGSGPYLSAIDRASNKPSIGNRWAIAKAQEGINSQGNVVDI